MPAIYKNSNGEVVKATKDVTPEALAQAGGQPAPSAPQLTVTPDPDTTTDAADDLGDDEPDEDAGDE